MRLNPYILAACSACLLIATIGCSGEGSGDRFTLQRGFEKLMGVDNATPVEMAAAAFDEKDPDVRRGAIEQLSHKDWALRDPYLKRFAALTDPKLEPDASVRAVSVRALGKAGDRQYMPQILAALDDPSPVVRWDAATVLDRMPDERAVVTLRRLAIQDDSVDVRAAAATALQHYRTDEVYRTLLRALEDRNFSVRSAAHGALVMQTGRDRGYEPSDWVDDPSQVGKETMPDAPQVRYRKRPWWDWFQMTKESETVDAPAATTQPERPWWDMMGVTD